MIVNHIKILVTVLLLTSAAFTIYYVFYGSESVTEPFSELGILGPNMKIGDYPRELLVGQDFNLFLYVGNQEGSSNYYRVYAKLIHSNQTLTEETPIDSPARFYWETLLTYGSDALIPITMRIEEAGVDTRLVFELWRYDTDTHDFVYHKRHVQLWLDVNTVS